MKISMGIASPPFVPIRTSQAGLTTILSIQQRMDRAEEGGQNACLAWLWAILSTFRFSTRRRIIDPATVEKLMIELLPLSIKRKA